MDLTTLSMVTKMMCLMFPVQQGKALRLLHVSMVLIVPLLDVVERQSQQVVSLWMFHPHVLHYVIRVIAFTQLIMYILAIHAMDK